MIKIILVKIIKVPLFQFSVFLNSINGEQNRDDMCDNLDKNYYTNTVKQIEYIILYLNSTMVEILSIINICLWSNFLKKIRILNESSIKEKNSIYYEISKQKDSISLQDKCFFS